ncbi:MAG: sigma-70 family RNA polymerase sigma factor, partial [Gemmatimonadetes bacterium]|nr:sigma-70 family RNA polymerase sigma factor [Gemmatimonadota bacterium]
MTLKPRPEERPAHPETDRLLVGRVVRGDDTALAALYDRWVDRVYSIAAHVLSSSDQADDVVERTFTQIWKDAARYDSERGSVAAWIVTIARSHALTMRRSEGRRLRHDEMRSQFLLDEGTIAAASPLQNLEAGEDRQAVERAMSRLPDEQERVVRMTFFEGLSQAEIAERLGI